MGKRTIPTQLQDVLAVDVRLTKQVFEWSSKTYGFENYKPWLKYLEISCHGLVWFMGTISALYLFPPYNTLWVNLLWLLTLDIIIVALTKAATRRRRPGYNPNDMFATVSVDKFSFPSGHATRALTLFFAFAFIYPLPGICVLLILAWSLAVSASRVLLGRHHLLDVVGGVGIAMLEFLILKATWMSDKTAASVAEYFFSEDPWSSA